MDSTGVSLISESLNISQKQVRNTLELLENGSTIPFISRYRKEATGSLDEVEITAISKEWNRIKELEKRKETILTTIAEQGKLTPELQRKIEQCWNSTELEDLYLPFKPKRKTRASVARDKGLEPLARLIFQQRLQAVESEAEKFLNEQILTIEEALQGARDIIAEWMSEDQRARNTLRRIFEKAALISSRVAKGKEEAGAKYRDYFDFSEPLKKCPSHRMLAMRRGEEEEFLKISILPENADVALQSLERLFLTGFGESREQVKMALHDGYKRLLEPAIETEFRQSSKEKADLEAIKVFAENLRQLLLAAPLGQKKVIGIDPGFRTGCKVVCLNANGDLLYNTTIYPHPPQADEATAILTLQDLAEDYDMEAIAIGNGTAGRETLNLCRRISFPSPVEIYLVSEAGASIYSASDVAREEFPDHDLTVRGAVSIGRRLVDPLAELVKIDAKSIGVGQYQHDVNQTLLKESLDRTVESAVNAVGINLNTASKHLLTYVSGLGPSLAQAIVQFRTDKGSFVSRDQLRQVPRLGEKAFEQCAGFLRIRDAHHPLDNTAVHPESYPIVEKMAADLGVDISELISNADLRKQIDLNKYVTKKTGLPTLRDILKELEKPGLDPRGKARPFEFGNVHRLEDLTTGLILPGIVTNLTNFGAFVDIGVKQDGLVHISQIANKFIKNPADVLSLGQEVQVKVVEIDIPRRRIHLSIKEV